VKAEDPRFGPVLAFLHRDLSSHYLMTVLVTSSPARGIRDTGNRDPIFSDMFEALLFFLRRDSHGVSPRRLCAYGNDCMPVLINYSLQLERQNAMI
jgi:hypothetical protein